MGELRFAIGLRNEFKFIDKMRTSGNLTNFGRSFSEILLYSKSLIYSDFQEQTSNSIITTINECFDERDVKIISLEKELKKLEQKYSDNDEAWKRKFKHAQGLLIFKKLAGFRLHVLVANQSFFVIEN